MPQPPAEGTGGPNRFPEARTKADAKALTSTCRYLGKTFYENDVITYQGEPWQCRAGTWVKKG